MKDFCLGVLAMLIILGYHTWEYEVSVTDGRFTYATSEGHYEWPKEPIRRPMTTLEGRRLLAEGRELEIGSYRD